MKTKFILFPIRKLIVLAILIKKLMLLIIEIMQLHQNQRIQYIQNKFQML